ncbi:MAG: SIMPL domain-containing protein [Candidatus Dadabacteria bacterium]
MRSYTSTLIIALVILFSVFLIVNTARYRFKSSESISVTGLAEKDFTADQIVWTGTFVRTGTDLRMAYSQLKLDESQIRQYLDYAGLKDSNYVFSSVDMQRNYQENYDGQGRMTGRTFTGFNLSQTFTVDSRNIAMVEKMSREITGLLQKGIELNSSAPRYYYSRLNELKIDLLSKAAADAKQRAESIAKNSDVNLGDLRKASMGVFQITGKNSNENYSYGGVFNTSSKEKTASITLKVDYQVK